MCILLQKARSRIDINHANKLGFTAVQLAVKSGSKEMVSLLIEHGADICVTTKLGDTLIKMAQRAGFRDIVIILANAGVPLR